MNGRVYDYNLGRFLSVDPIIQAPGNSQSINPYSYIMNNPLSGTDPTGYTAEKEEVKIKVDAPTGSRIKRTVTATVASNGKGGATVTFSGGNGASRNAAKNAVAGNSKLSGAGFNISDIGSQQGIAQPAPQQGRSPGFSDFTAGVKELWNNASEYMPQIFGGAAEQLSNNLGGVVSPETILDTTGEQALSDGIVSMSQGNVGGLAQAGAGLVAGKFKAANKAVDKVYGDYNQARNEALKWLDKKGFKAEAKNLG